MTKIKSTYKVEHTPKAVRSQLAQLKGEVGVFKANVSLLAVNTVLCAVKHGDTTLATELVAICRGPVHTKALITWLETFGCFRGVMNKETDTFNFKVNKQARTELLAELEASNIRTFATRLRGEVNPFDMVEEAVFKGHDLPAKIAALIKSTLAVMNDDDKKDHDKNNFELLAELQAIK